jgi:hypothetical protein
MRIVIDEDGDRYRWRLVRANGHGADVVARSVRAYPDQRDCYRSVDAVAEVTADAARVVRQPDGHWRWIVISSDGEPLAESPGIFRDATACGEALAELSHQAATIQRRSVGEQVDDGGLDRRA